MEAMVLFSSESASTLLLMECVFLPGDGRLLHLLLSFSFHAHGARVLRMSAAPTAFLQRSKSFTVVGDNVAGINK